MWLGRGKRVNKPERSAKPVQAQAESDIPLLGFVIERKIGVGALLLALATAFYATYAYLKGPDVTPVPPEQVVLVSCALPNQEKYARVFAQ